MTRRTRIRKEYPCSSVSICGKAFSLDGLHARSIEAVNSSAFDKIRRDVEDAVAVLQSTQSVSSMRYDDVQTVLESLCHRIAVRRRSHRIPFTSHNQNRDV